ncbi:MAG: hypothetical protein ABI383_01620, partial [Acidobacteriaceae bacterium]
MEEQLFARGKDEVLAAVDTLEAFIFKMKIHARTLSRPDALSRLAIVPSAPRWSEELKWTELARIAPWECAP